MIETKSTSGIQKDPSTVPASFLKLANLSFSLGGWVPGLFGLQSGPVKSMTNYNGQAPVVFVVDTIDLPIPSSRWGLTTESGTTFDELRAGRIPVPTQAEMAQRRKAIDMAREVRPLIDIRPLTASTILRLIRKDK